MNAVDAHLKHGDCLGPCAQKLAGPDEPEASVGLNVYPNPFSTKAEVVFSLLESGKARLELYDAKGSLVTVLFDGEMEAGTNYHATIDGTNLPEGIYIARFVTNDNVMNKKIVLTK